VGVGITPPAGGAAGTDDAPPLPKSTFGGVVIVLSSATLKFGRNGM
jgi:hypothetical protein